MWFDLAATCGFGINPFKSDIFVKGINLSLIDFIYQRTIIIFSISTYSIFFNKKMLLNLWFECSFYLSFKYFYSVIIKVANVIIKAINEIELVNLI